LVSLLREIGSAPAGNALASSSSDIFLAIFRPENMHSSQIFLKKDKVQINCGGALRS
jgi:hypothetical protein